MRLNSSSLLIGLASMMLYSTVQAACLSEAKVTALVSGYPNQAISSFTDIKTLSDAYCSQDKYIKQLQKTLGNPIGYKVGFTGTPLQQRFNINKPAVGVLLEGMFIPNNSRLPRNFGYRTAIEPDFMVTVKSNAIMDIATPREALAYLQSVHPYIELVAMQFAPEEKITGNKLVAINIAATKMIMGDGVPLANNEASYQLLGTIDTEFVDEAGNMIQRADSSNLMGHPLNVVYWLVQEFKAQGKHIKAGDRLSLGAVGRLFPLKVSGKTYTYRFVSTPEIAPIVVHID